MPTHAPFDIGVVEGRFLPLLKKPKGRAGFGPRGGVKRRKPNVKRVDGAFLMASNMKGPCDGMWQLRSSLGGRRWGKREQADLPLTEWRKREEAASHFRILAVDSCWNIDGAGASTSGTCKFQILAVTPSSEGGRGRSSLYPYSVLRNNLFVSSVSCLV